MALSFELVRLIGGYNSPKRPTTLVYMGFYRAKGYNKLMTWKKFLTIHCDFGKGAIKALKAMSFPFLMLGDIDEVWEEMIECKSKLKGIDDA